MGNQVKAAKMQAWRLAPACCQARCCLRQVPWSRRSVRRSHVADASGSVSEAMQAVSRRRI